MKDKIYLGLSIVLLFATIFAIISGDVAVGVLNNTLSFQWISLLILCLLLPLLNTAEIIINRDSWNVLYWTGLILNAIAIYFILRFFKLELF